MINETIQWGVLILALIIANGNFSSIDRAIRAVMRVIEIQDEEIEELTRKIKKPNKQDEDE